MNTNDVVSLISKIREKANRFIVLAMTKYGIEGIVTSHGDIINALFNNPRLTMAEIAGKIGRDKSTVTTLVDKLVRFGYVAKERDTEDTRVVYVTLTPKGSELKPIFNTISREVLNALYFDISENEKEELIRILNKIYKNL
ncbi:MarR family transcriptional regulator [Desulfosporosinus sp. FKB]|uniref:MarR family winged helix-turn-helix transcriptional regulator n=1 Tax=Desulfosporosinus sp. FKB TaxID=1969835 RepID=UPI000B4A494C|nr:MarR family transcriptional regulator [Desulfosporosinus sp. FKB]